MADNDSLNWIIEKIVDCRGKDITDEGWVNINPMSGKGNASVQVSITPSSYWNDCKEAVVTISADTGDKKYITINRCNPDCNCDAVGFSARTITDKVKAEGGRLEIAEYTMEFCCPGKGAIGLVNVDGDCDYDIEETVDAENPCIISGVVIADVDENTSTANEKNFSYYVTYNGVRCDQIPLVQNAFSQERTINPCENEDCNSVSVSVEGLDDSGDSKYVDYRGEIITANVTTSDCWTISERHDSYGGQIEYVKPNSDFTKYYIKITENKSEEEREGAVFFDFTNELTGDKCGDMVTYIQYGNPTPPQPSYNTCQEVNIGNVTEKTLPATITPNQSTYSIVDLDADGQPNSMHFEWAGGARIIKNLNTLRYVGEINVITPYANINDNTDVHDRSELINYSIGDESIICGSFTLYQKGIEVVGCSLSVESIITYCYNNEVQYIEIRAKKSDSKCEDMTLIYKIENTPITGAINVSTSEYVNYNKSITPSLEAGDYNVKWYNQSDAANSGRTSVHVESCGTSPSNKVKTRVMLKADRGSYIYTIDNFYMFFGSTTVGIKRVEFSKDKWYGVYSDRTVTQISRGGHISPSEEGSYCNASQKTYQLIFEDPSERYVAIYQDVDLDLSELGMDDDGNLTCNLQVYELCDGSINCGCGVSSNARLQLKQYNQSTGERTTPGVNWYEGETQDSPYSYICFADENYNPGRKIIHMPNNVGQDLYRMRIAYKVTGMTEDDFHKVSNPEAVGFNTVILINMYPDTVLNN